jgi:hypothetical protein
MKSEEATVIYNFTDLLKKLDISDSNFWVKISVQWLSSCLSEGMMCSSFGSPTFGCSLEDTLKDVQMISPENLVKFIKGDK